MKILNSFVVTLSLFFSVQALASLNPNPDPRVFYVASDSSNNLNRMDLSFAKNISVGTVTIVDFDGILIGYCQSESTVTTQDPNTHEWKKSIVKGVTPKDATDPDTCLTNSSKGGLSLVGQAVEITVGRRGEFPELSGEYILCVDGDCRKKNQLPVGKDKKITSKLGTRLLFGAMGKDSVYLTLDQMKQYIANNALPDKSKDTVITGDIYDYVVKDLNATVKDSSATAKDLNTTGDSAEVIIELVTAISKDAELRKYSLVHGWSSFVVDDNNAIQSKISETCTDDNWETGLIAGATCLKLTVKDGGENDTDGEQVDVTGDVNGIIKNTISPSGGGCVYNPNAPARFDIGFILLMILSAYYLIRRKRRLIN